MMPKDFVVYGNFNINKLFCYDNTLSEMVYSYHYRIDMVHSL